MDEFDEDSWSLSDVFSVVHTNYIINLFLIHAFVEILQPAVHPLVVHLTPGWWLCERQLPSGGLNGRPEKLPDVCYSWWVLSSLAILGRIHWIDSKKLTKYILACQVSRVI